MPAAAEDEDREGVASRHHHLRLVGPAGSEGGAADPGPTQPPAGGVTPPAAQHSVVQHRKGHDAVADPAWSDPPGAAGEGPDGSSGHSRAGHDTRHLHWHLPHDHHILIEPDEDRWEWRRKIRQNRRKLFFYRWAVALAGLLLVAAGLATGPLPGPGGIPLVLLGVAVWSSEFEWAHKLMQWLKRQLHRFRQWGRGRQMAFWIAFFACCGLIGYLYLLVLGVPGWMPNVAATTLRQLPGV